MKNLFVFLFPEMEYMKGGESFLPFLNDCINKRYLSKGWTFAIVKYKGSKIFGITAPPHAIVEADITFEKSSPYFSADWTYANFELIASQIGAENFDRITIGGYHLFDCVKRLADELYKINSNVTIDSDLTEMFLSQALTIGRGDVPPRYKDDFKPEIFDPNRKLLEVMEDMGEFIFRTLHKRYSEAVWGIDKTLLEKLEKGAEDFEKLQAESSDDVTEK